MLLLTAGLGGFTSSDSGADTPDIETPGSVSGAEYPPSNVDDSSTETEMEPGTGTEVPGTNVETDPEQNTGSDSDNETETDPETGSSDAAFNVTAEAGQSISHSLNFDGKSFVHDSEPEFESADGSNAAITYTITHTGDEAQQFDVNIDFEPRGGGDTLTERTKTHDLEPGETMTITLSLDTDNYTDE